MAQHTRGRAVPKAQGVQAHPRSWLLLITVALLLGGAFVFTLATGRGSATALVPERTTHDFGTVSMSKGEIRAQIPLTVREAAVVTDVSSS